MCKLTIFSTGRLFPFTEKHGSASSQASKINFVCCFLTKSTFFDTASLVVGLENYEAITGLDLGMSLLLGECKLALLFGLVGGNTHKNQASTSH